MKKFILVALSLILAFTLALTGCASDRYKAVKINGRQDTTYAVTSNGGSAVKYGNYVYFINGSRGYADEDGKANKFGSVVKGGLYRAEFINKTTDGGVKENYYANGVKEFIPAVNDKTGLALSSTQALNYKKQNENVVDNQLLVPKTIGTSGYSDGGIYIFDDYVYYATPVNSKDKSGKVMDDYTLFLRTKLDGSKTEEIYTSQSSTSSKPYGFYKYGGKMYLIVLENNEEYNNYVNVIDIEKKKITTVATNVDSVIFPTNPIYYNGMETNSVYDYIYLRYAANNYPEYEDDKVSRSGYVLAYMRPDGKDIVNFAEGNSALELVAVRDNLVFYKDMNLTQKVLVARDNVSMFSKDEEGFKTELYSGVSAVASSSVIYPFVEGKGDINSNAISVLTINESTTSSGSSTTTIQTLTYYSSIYSQGRSIGSGSAIEIQTHDNTGFYYTINDGTNVSLRYNVVASGSILSKTICSNVGTSFKADKVGSYLVYLATLEDKFDNYTFFANIYGGEDYEKVSTFVGTRLEGDIRSSIESVEIYEDTFDKVKTSYEIDGKLDVTDLKLVIKYYADEEGNVVEEIVDVKKDWIEGFDTSTASEGLDLTIVYTDKSDSFATIYTITVG